MSLAIMHIERYWNLSWLWINGSVYRSSPTLNGNQINYLFSIVNSKESDFNVFVQECFVYPLIDITIYSFNTQHWYLRNLIFLIHVQSL